MYRMLIVDNERIVVESLISYFERRQSSVLEIQGAFSAREALTIMDQTKVDILLTDIRMPGMDGLQLQKEVSRRWPWCRTILLTGFNEFDYIQEAMRAGGVDYLLKTEGNQKIEESVLRTMAILDDQLRTDELISRAQEAYQRALPLIQNRLLLNLARGWGGGTDNLADRFEQAGITLDTQTVWPVYVIIDAEEDTKDRDMLLMSVEQIAVAFVRNRGVLYQVQIDEETLVWLMSFRENCQENYLWGALEAVQQQCLAKLKVNLSVCMAEKGVAWDQLPETVEELRRRMNSQTRYDENGQIIDGMLIKLSNSQAKDVYISGEVTAQLDKLALLQVYLENGSRYDYDRLLHEIFSSVEGVSADACLDAQMEIRYSLIAMLLRQMNRWQLKDALAQNFDLNRLTTDTAWTACTEMLCAFSNAIFKAKMQTGMDRDVSLVNRIHRTVRNNLGGDLSLIRLGDMEGVSPSYLSRVYKNISGESLKNYISRMRMERAQELLTQSSMLGREVGAAVGFPTEQSFYRFFKTMCGMTPLEFRQEHTNDK